MKKLILLTAFCLALCGCSEKADMSDNDIKNESVTTTVTTTVTKIASSRETTTTTKEPAPDNNPEDFELFQDIGKSYKLFNNKRIVEAYKTGDDSQLSEFEEAIYSKAKEVLDEIKAEYQTDLDIELAVYEYILLNSTYDKMAIDAFGIPMENSHNPYGILVENTGICLGYTTTFQLFMDMAGIPCETIYGTAIEGEEHAWNQVEIDGNWYYVDATWDDPVPEEEGRLPYHSFFNVTTEYMKDTFHEWDESLCHQSDSLEASYYLTHFVKSSEVEKGIAQARYNGSADIVVRHKNQLWSGFKYNIYERHSVYHDGYYYTNFIIG